MAKLERYIMVGQKRMRCGYTTGTCAAAATRGAAALLLGGVQADAVYIDTPAGITVEAELLHYAGGTDWARCAVRKDGGDDPDVTDGTLIYATVRRTDVPGIVVDGGEGVGRVTRQGLDQPVGAAAINSVPRRMIAHQATAALRAAGADGGLEVIISIPEGQVLAKRTFNPRLGIVGGLSVLGTSGIVRPMSEAALVDSVRLELNMLSAAGVRDVVITPGNYGETFSRQVLGLSLKHWATCSNYIGQALDYAAGLGFRSLLLVGHLGKLCKVAAGSMNTHSKVSDGRRESLVTHTALCGGVPELLRAIFATATTDEAVALLVAAGLLAPVMESMGAALGEALCHRAGPNLEVEALFFSNQHGILGGTPGVQRLLALHRAQPGDE